MTRTIGLLCWCKHDTIDHAPEGCLRCRDTGHVVRLLDFRHRFMPIEWLPAMRSAVLHKPMQRPGGHA